MTEDVLLGAILRGPALRVVDDERDHTVGRKYSIRPSSDALLSQAEAGRALLVWMELGIWAGDPSGLEVC